MQHTTGKKIPKLIVKTLLWVALGVLGIVVILFIALQFQGTQKYIAGKLTTYISQKTKSKVSLGGISVAFPTEIALSDLYVEDLHKDTLLYIQSVKLNLNMWNLLSKKIELIDVSISTATMHVYREFPDTLFNYSFIPKAFASKQDVTIAKDTMENNPLGFTIKNINLKNIYLTYHDTLSGTNADLNLGAFTMHFDEFDLNKKNILIQSIALKNAVFLISQQVPVQIDSSASKPFAYRFGLSNIKLNDVKATYLNEKNLEDIRAVIGRLTVNSDLIDIQKQKLQLTDLSLTKSSIVYTVKKSFQRDTLKANTTTTTTAPSNWLISLKQIDLNDNAFGYTNENENPTVSGMDFNHLLFRNINLNGKDISVTPEKISLALNDLNLQEEKGFSLKHFSTDLTYTKTRLELSKLNIETDNSKIGDYVKIDFPSFNAFKDSIGTVEANLNLPNTTISLKDIVAFKPDLLAGSHLNINETTKIHLNCKIDGPIDDLTISKLQIKTLEKTVIDLKGTIKDITVPKSLYANIRLENFETGKTDIENIFSGNSIPENISIPASIQTHGKFKGYISKFDAEANLRTSIGDVAAKIQMDTPSIDTTYNAEVAFTNFDLGKLLKDTALLGSLTAHTRVHGKGLSANTLHAQIFTTVNKMTLKKYAYKNLLIEGTVDKKSFDGKINMADTNIAFSYAGYINLDRSNTAYNFSFNLIGADLKALHLSDENIRVSTVLQTDLKKNNTENITGRAVLKNTFIIKDDVKYPVDSLLLRSTYTDNTADISIASSILNANLKGDVTLHQLPMSFKKFLGNYFDLQQKDSAQKLKPQKFKFDLTLTDPTFLTEGFVPELKKLTPFSAKGEYDSESNLFNFDLNLPQLTYSNMIVDTLTISVKSTAESLKGTLKVNEISNPTLKLENIQIASSLAHNQLHFSLQTAKDDSTKILSLAGILKSEHKTFDLKFYPNLILNQGKWTIDKSNELVFSEAGLIATNLIFRDSTQTIVVNSSDKNALSPLKIDFKSFRLETFSKLIENEEALARGTIDGSIVLNQDQPAVTLTSDLWLKALRFKNIPTGDIHFLASNTSNPNNFDLKLNLSGNDNQIDVEGSYTRETETPTINLLVDITQLNLKTAEPFTFGEVTQMSGSVKGKATISGSTNKPDITGTLQFTSCGLRPKFLDSYLRIEDETINLDSKKIRLNSFTLIDSLNNKATVDGYADIKDFKSIPLNLQLKTNNFLALNTTEKDNDLYFGTIYLDSDLSIKGNSNRPVVTGKLGLKKGTLITYVKPENMASQNDYKGIVEFTDTTETQRNIMTRKKMKNETTTSTKGVSLKTSIDFDKDVELKMLVDRSSGDSLYIKGSGQLEFTLDEGGQMGLIGKYRINEGGYHLTINDLITKNFSIAKGSSVTWSGDVTDPYVDIDAIYKTKASPADLIEGQLSGADQLERNKYRTLMTFLVYLKMNGFVTSPTISFDIQQPANERGALNGAVNAKLTELRGDESQLNKQVFALLALNRFIGEDPFESGGAGGLASTSRASASRILTQQLNNLSAKYVKGIDLNLGVNSYEDYSSGRREGRTQLELGVSKTLLNDKITVQVGGNIDVEGEKSRQNNASDVAGNISLEYKLTDDGRYKLKGYRKNEYANPIEGELIKTGFGVIYRRNYNKLKELFSKPESRNRITE